jgi:hypothetical protein
MVLCLKVKNGDLSPFFPGVVGAGVAPDPRPGEAYGIGAVPSEYSGTKRGRGFAGAVAAKKAPPVERGQQAFSFYRLIEGSSGKPSSERLRLKDPPELIGLGSARARCRRDR